MARTEPVQHTGGLRPALRLVRWENCLFAAAATAVGFASGASAGPPRWRLVVAMAVVALVLAFGNVVNDLFDHEADRRSKAWRPLPSGQFSRRAAGRLATALAGLAVAAAVPLGAGPFLFVVSMVGLGWAYSARTKHLPLLGNLSVAVQVGSTIVFGALAAGHPTAATAAGAVLVLLYSLTLEVAKTVEDQDDDGAVGARTIAHVVPRTAQGPLVLAPALVCGAAALVAGVALDAPARYWLVLTPLAPLVALAWRWRTSPPGARAAAPVGAYLAATKALWCLALLGLLSLP